MIILLLKSTDKVFNNSVLFVGLYENQMNSMIVEGLNKSHERQ